MKTTYVMQYADLRAPQHYETLQAAVAGVALTHENVEFSPEAEDVRVHIGPLTLGKIVKSNRVGN